MALPVIGANAAFFLGMRPAQKKAPRNGPAGLVGDSGFAPKLSFDNEQIDCRFLYFLRRIIQPASATSPAANSTSVPGSGTTVKPAAVNIWIAWASKPP